MTCPHTLKPDAGFCSQCLGCAVQHVTIEGDQLLVDGVAVRTIEPEVNAYYQRRGGRRKK